MISGDIPKAIGRVEEGHPGFLGSLLVHGGVPHVHRALQVVALHHQADVFPLLLARAADALPILKVPVELVGV